MVSSLNRALFFTSAGGPPPDTDPNAFGFTNATAVSAATLTTSNTITPIGYDAQTTWSVGGGGEGSVNGGAYASSGTISPAQTLTIRATSSSSYETTTSHIVTIGIVTSTWSITTGPPAVSYTAAGTYSFVVPAGVTSVNMVAIGGGGGGQGGGRYGQGPGGGGAQLSFINSISVTPSETLTVIVGAGGLGGAGFDNGSQGAAGGNGENSSVRRGGTDLVMAKGAEGASGNNYGRGGGIFGDGVGSGRSAGGDGGRYYSGSERGGGGGGTGGYSGQGGQGGSFQFSSPAGAGMAATSGGGGGGGSAGGSGGGTTSGWYQQDETGSQTNIIYSGGGGGGTGLGAIGSNGAGASFGYNSPATSGGGGSGGGAGSGATGGLFGGGGGGGGFTVTEYWDGSTVYFTGLSPSYGGAGGRGGVRITWNGKTFPSNSG